VLTDRAFIPIAEVPDALRSRLTKAVQGTVARSGETLLLALDAEQGAASTSFVDRS
jgi:hypothetical protein